MGEDETKFRSRLIACNRFIIQSIFFSQLFKLQSNENNQVVLLPGYHKGIGGLWSWQKCHPKQQEGCSYCQVLQLGREGINFRRKILYI